MFSQVKGAASLLESQKQSLTKEIAELEEEESILNLVLSLFQKLLDHEILESSKVVESLQTEGLSTVFPDQDLEVKANVQLKRGKVSLDLMTLRKYSDGMVIEGSSRDSFGGSVVAVQSIIMRILVLLRHKMRPLLFLDEPLPAVDQNYSTNVGEFLKSLCDKMGLDILIVTHNVALSESATTCYKVKNVDGVAKIGEVINHENRRERKAKAKTSSFSTPEKEA
jgi:hypothetical protein